MKKSTSFDFAIIGAGASGLQLLYHLVKSRNSTDLSIVLFDSGDRSSKSWCFWNDDISSCFPFLIEKSWSNVSYCKSDGCTIRQSIAPFSYHYISSEKFFNYFFNDFIPSHTNITLVQSNVTELVESNDFVSIECENGSKYTAGKVADSRRGTQGEEAEIFQHFKGKFIEFEEEMLDSDCVTLMDFSLHFSTSQMAVFHYLLPFSKNQALIETTVFTQLDFDDSTYEKIWNEYMRQKFIGKHFKILSTESGTIPMKKYASVGSKRILKIGIAGGNLKPSTGYAFVRMNEHAKAIVQNLTLKKPKRYDFYDKILLGLIQHDIKQIPGVMDRLFTRVPFTRILRFLDDKSTFWGEIKLLSKLDIPLFLRQLFR